MPGVCVIGGGTAGAEAAREAAVGGAEVTVIEKSEPPAPPWKSWPDLIHQSSAAGDTVASSRRIEGPHAAKVLAKEAKSAGLDFILTSDGSKIRFDSVVAATGSGFEPTSFPGHRKPGVLILDGMGQYAHLGRIRGSIEGAVVHGEGTRGLQVSDRLAGSGRRVHVLISCWQEVEPSAAVFAVIRQAAEERGVSIATGTLAKAVGSGSLEAVVAGGTILPCDTLAVLPRRIPRVIPMLARLGRRGGLLVDRGLRSSSPRTFAAGGCAELGTGLPQSAILEGEAAISGRIAGANSTGQHLSMDSVRLSESTFFGLRWTRVGGWPFPAGASGIRLETVSRRWATDSACTIVYERLSGRVVGLETVQGASAGSIVMPPMAPGSASLRTLAYGGLGGSSDISLVSDTARLGLRDWSRF